MEIGHGNDGCMERTSMAYGYGHDYWAKNALAHSMLTIERKMPLKG